MKWSINISSYPALENCLFSAVNLTKHIGVDRYKYSGDGIGFEKKESYSVGNEIGRNVIIFEVDMSSSKRIDNRKKDILIFAKGPTQELEHNLVQKKCNLTKENTKFCLSLHYNGVNTYLFVNDTVIIKFKAKDSEITPYQLCLGSISKDWSADNMKITGFNGYIYDFSIDYDAIAVYDILDIHK